MLVVKKKKLKAKDRMVPKDGKTILSIADKYEPKMTALVLRMFKAIQGMSANKIKNLDPKDWAKVAKAGSDVEVTYLSPLESIYLDILSASAELMDIEFPDAFTIKSPNAISWARDQSSQFLTNITDKAKESIQQIISNAQAQGVNTKTQAKQIQQFIGLTPRQINAIQSLEDSLNGISRLNRGAQIMRLAQLDDVFPLASVRGRQLSPAQIQKIITNYAHNQLRYRAQMIARTETMAASNMGREITWQELQSQGLISKTAVRVWYVTPDDRTCPLCQALHLTESLLTDKSAQLPPLHPQCRCVILLDYKVSGINSGIR